MVYGSWKYFGKFPNRFIETGQCVNPTRLNVINSSYIRGARVLSFSLVQEKFQFGSVCKFRCEREVLYLCS